MSFNREIKFKLWYIQIMEYFSDELLSHPKFPWGDLKYVLPNENSQSEKDAYDMIPVTEKSRKDKATKIVQLVAVRCSGRQNHR
jgi:hypothetical protein